MTASPPAALALLLGPFLSACFVPTPSDRSDAGTGADGGAPSSDARGPADSADSVIGAFLVQLSRSAVSGGTDVTTVLGAVKDRPTPPPRSWSAAANDGPCAVLKPSLSLCTPECTSPDVCVAEGKCQAWPSARSAGTVTVTGIKTASGESSFTMQPAGATKSYQPEVELQFPGFAEGDPIRLETSGGDFASFAVTSSGISPLALKSGDLPLVRGQAVTVAWTPAALGASSTIHVKLDISHHGGTRGMIECDAEDTGSLLISGVLVGKLLDLGVSGWPTIVVTRHALGSAGLPGGRVTLDILSEVEKSVVIPGLTSCQSDDDCPKGQACQGDLACK